MPGKARRAYWPLGKGHRAAASTKMVVMYDNDDDVGRAPICPSCGVTALPAHRSNVIDTHFVCDNEGCEAFGEAI